MNKLEKVKWGFIGCGEVTEKKSGPAFSMIRNSEVVAVMSRKAEKAESYARRNNIPRWYTDAQLLIGDEDVNAVYIATPPSSSRCRWHISPSGRLHGRDRRLVAGRRRSRSTRPLRPAGPGRG